MSLVRPVVELDASDPTGFRFRLFAALSALLGLILLLPTALGVSDTHVAFPGSVSDRTQPVRTEDSPGDGVTIPDNPVPDETVAETALPAVVHDSLPKEPTAVAPTSAPAMAVFTGGIETESATAGPTPSWRVAGAVADTGPGLQSQDNDERVARGYIRPGDTIAGILSTLLTGAEVDALNAACRKVFPLNTIQIGREYAITTRQDGFVGLTYEIDLDQRLVVEKAETGFQAFRQPIEYDQRIERVEGAIESSLFGAVEGAGESADLAIALADIFACEVDFIRDLRQGDSFRLLVEKRYQQGVFKCYGNILAATFTNQDETYEGYLVEDAKGLKRYYDASGKNLRKAFLRAPLKFSRISSGYTMRRRHPILNIVRPHLGIDYAAPAGTPVMAVGDGVVASAGWMAGGGKAIKLDHSGDYKSTYMHLSRYAAGIRKGKRVSQGDVIGYVGMTGLATGPHLDFRLEQGGKPLNPQKQLARQPAPSLPAREMDAFLKTVAELKAKLQQDQHPGEPVAQRDRPENDADRAL